jgi:predicted phosphodiesterase
MRIGLLTDIHEDVEHLRAALEVLSGQGVDRIVQIGDALDAFVPGRDRGETVSLLRAAKVTGVWGNHDFCYCRDVTDELRASVDPDVLTYMAEIQPRLVLADCHFSHVDPFRNPNDVLELWYATERPETLEAAVPSFAAVSQRVSFIGHYHRWQVVSDLGPIAWHGDVPLTLDIGQRFLVTVGPLFAGHFAVYDTDTGVLVPFRC